MSNRLARWGVKHLVSIICIGLGLVSSCLAQPNTQSVPQSGLEKNTLAPLLFSPPPVATSKVVTRLGAALSVESLYRDGNYAQAAKEGLLLLHSNQLDDELRLLIGNSLAWTGRLKEAVAVYDSLFTTDFRAAAELGLANINRWEGKDHLALIIYKSILKAEPDNADAKEGLRLALREIRPRGTVGFGGSKDSAGTTQHHITLNARWRDETNTSVWEIETKSDQLANSVIRVTGTDLTVRYRLLDTPYKPRLDVSVAKNNVYANAGIEFDAIPLKLSLGKVNWGKLSDNPIALASGLWATHAGDQIDLPTPHGRLFASADAYRISDGNSITASTLRLTPTWQPLGKHFKIFGGVETRSAKFASPSYWSPKAGYGSGYVGVAGEWGDSDWDVNASAQVGNRLYGEAGRSWGTALAAKSLVSPDIALGISLSAMASKRGTQRYSDRSAYLTVDKLW